MLPLKQAIPVMGMAFLCLLIPASASANTDVTETSKTLHFACNDFPPLKIRKPESAARPGIDVELLRRISEEMGYDAQFHFFPWKRAYVTVQNGQMDALCSCSWQEERERDFIYTDQTGSISKGFFQMAATSLPVPESFEQLKGLRVGVVSGYSLENELLDAGIRKLEYAGRDELLTEMLLAGRIDVLYAFADPVRFSLMRKVGPSVAVNYRELSQAPYFACFSRKVAESPDRVRQFNEELKKLQKDGVVSQIRRKYLPEN